MVVISGVIQSSVNLHFLPLALTPKYARGAGGAAHNMMLRVSVGLSNGELFSQSTVRLVVSISVVSSNNFLYGLL